MSFVEETELDIMENDYYNHNEIKHSRAYSKLLKNIKRHPVTENPNIIGFLISQDDVSSIGHKIPDNAALKLVTYNQKSYLVLSNISIDDVFNQNDHIEIVHDETEYELAQLLLSLYLTHAMNPTAIHIIKKIRTITDQNKTAIVDSCSPIYPLLMQQRKMKAGYSYAITRNPKTQQTRYDKYVLGQFPGSININ